MPEDPSIADALGPVYCKREGLQYKYWLIVNGGEIPMSHEFAYFVIKSRGFVLEVLPSDGVYNGTISERRG